MSVLQAEHKAVDAKSDAVCTFLHWIIIVHCVISIDYLVIDLSNVECEKVCTCSLTHVVSTLSGKGVHIVTKRHIQSL
jgi:hypothetical protein